jgi:hypothetical protein
MRVNYGIATATKVLAEFDNGRRETFRYKHGYFSI